MLLHTNTSNQYFKTNYFYVSYLRNSIYFFVESLIQGDFKTFWFEANFL